MSGTMGQLVGPLLMGTVLIIGSLALIALFVDERRTKRRALDALAGAVSRLGIIAGHGAVPAHGKPHWRAVVGELRGRAIALELVARSKGSPPSTYLSRHIRASRTLPLTTALYSYNLPWLSFIPKTAGQRHSKGLETGDPAFDGAYLTTAIVSMSLLSGPTTLKGHFALSPPIAPVLARVPRDVAFSFDGEFVLASWREWHLEEDRLLAVVDALEVLATDVPSWVDQLERAGAAIR